MPIVVITTTVSMLLVLGSNRNSAAWALGGAITLAVLVPSHSPPHSVTVSSIAGVTVLLVAAVVKNYRVLRVCRPPMTLILFLTYSAAVWLRAENKNGLLNVGIQGALVLMALLTAAGTHLHRRVLIYALLGAIFAQFALAYSEEFLRLPALWPRPDGSDVLTSRLNPLATALPGRAMGSTSQPIPLGMLSGMALISALWVAFRTRRWILPLVAAISAAVTIVFSGTRSALVGCLLAGLVLLLLTARVSRIPRYLAALPVVVILYLAVDLPGLLGFGDFQGTESYSHRTSVLQSAEALFNRSPMAVLWGSGYDSIGTLLGSGVAGTDGILVFDQEFFRTATAGGLTGGVLLVLAIFSGFKKGDTLARMLLAYVSFFLLVFDGLSWFLSASLLVLCASGPLWGEDDDLCSDNISGSRKVTGDEPGWQELVSKQMRGIGQ